MNKRKYMQPELAQENYPDYRCGNCSRATRKLFPCKKHGGDGYEYPCLRYVEDKPLVLNERIGGKYARR